MEEQRKAVRAMQVYIREHITEDITPADLAKASNFSPWYARKLFIKNLGMAPAVYIRRLRLSMSALRLRDEKTAVLDVAMELGFGSEDGYQRAFRREFGCNPKEYALSPVPIWLFTPYLIENPERKVSKMSETRTVFIQAVEKPARKVIIKRGIRAKEYLELLRRGRMRCVGAPHKHQINQRRTCMPLASGASEEAARKRICSGCRGGAGLYRKYP